MKTCSAVVAIAMQTMLITSAAWAAPYVRIVSPVQGQCTPGPDVKVQFEAGGMSLGPSAWNLHFKLDEDPFQVQYDGNHAHVFKNVRPGTHTVRVYAANAMHEAIPGTQQTVTFSVGYWDNANAPTPGSPTLTYNLPQGEYLGIDAADITVDFLVENTTLAPGGNQVAYYVDGRRFLVQDQCGPRHVKNLTAGYHRVRMELQDANGDLIPGPFNSTERVILVSPDSVIKSPAPYGDGYENLPRIDSIKGSMTMGQPWVATAPVEPLTQADVEKQESLTVRTADGTVGLHGGPPPETGVPVAVHEKEIGTAGQAAGTFSMKSVPPGDFPVRQGGETDMTDLDTAVPETAPSPGVRRGSIVMQSQEPEVGVSSEIVTPEKVKDQAAAQAEDKVSSGSIKVKKAAPATSATRVLDRKATPTPKPEPKTTATVTVKDPGTTAAKAIVKRNDKPTTAAPAKPAQPTPKID